MKTEENDMKTIQSSQKQTFSTKSKRKKFWLLPMGLVAMLLLSSIFISGCLIYANYNQGKSNTVATDNSPLEEVAPSATPPKEITDEYFIEQFKKSKQDRKSPMGIEAKVTVPSELRGGVRLQTKKLSAMKKDGYKMPMDFADLAQRIADGKLVEMPLASENYVVDVGGAASSKEFTTFNFDSKNKSSVLKSNSKDYKIIAKFAESSSKKLDLTNSRDRRRIKMRLLRTLHPKAKTLFENISSEYAQKFNRPLRINSMTRSLEYQVNLSKVNPNSFRFRKIGKMPPHTSGYAFDIPYTFMDADEQKFIMKKLAELEKTKSIDALREDETSKVFHIFYLDENKVVN